MAQVLTDRQTQVLNFLSQYHADNRVMPTRPEIAKAFKRTTQTIAEHLEIMAHKGAIELTPAKHRGITVIGDSHELAIK